jgi:UDP-glucuronate 4-epimerase
MCLLYHQNHGVPAVGLRYFSVYGPRQRPDMAFNRFCRAVARGQPITIYGDGRQTRDFTFVADIVAATRAAASAPAAPGRVYNIGGASRVSLLETLDVLAEVSGRRLDLRIENRQHGDVANTGADISHARADLGYAPATSLRDGLRAEYEWMTARVRPGGRFSARPLGSGAQAARKQPRPLRAGARG